MANDQLIASVQAIGIPTANGEIDLEFPEFLRWLNSASTAGHGDEFAMLKAAGPLPPCVAHCFTGTLAEAEDYLALGLNIGITGWICDERRGGHLHDVVRRIPVDRLMIETDGPYLLPRTLSPKPASRRNEPAFLTEVARVVAEARGESVASLAASSTEVTTRFFRIKSTAIT